MVVWQKITEMSFWRLLLVWALGAALALSLVGPAKAVQTLYGINSTATDGSGFLFTIDTNTGASTLVGPLSSSMGAFGLGIRDNKLYTYDQIANPQVIRQLDPLTGATVNTINIGTPQLIAEGDLTFRSSDGIGFLTSVFGPNSVVAPLYSFDITVPSYTYIGSMGIFMDGLEYWNGTLYGLSQNYTDPPKKLYTINPTNAALTLIGSTGVSGPMVGDLAFRADGTLFASMDSNLYTLDVNTGAATLIGPIGYQYVTGLAFLDSNPIPTPGALLLLGSGLSVLAGWRRFRKG